MPSVTRQPSQTRARRQATELAVLEAVERLLAAGESFTALPVSRIAEEAGMRRSTFYDYFPDKATLILRLTESATDELFAAATAFVEDDSTGREDLDAVVLHHLREYRKHQTLLNAVFEVAAYEPDVAAHWTARVEAFAAVLAARLRRDRRAGLAAASLDPKAAAAFIAWGTERAVIAHVAARPASSDPAFARGIASATWGAMGRTP